MIKLFIGSICILILNISIAKPIDMESAKKIGANFLTQQDRSLQVGDGDLAIAYTSTDGAIEASNYFYIFNHTASNGFVIVAADDQATPILGYSLESKIDADHIPNNVMKWLEHYKEQMRYIIKNSVDPTNEIKTAWINLSIKKPMQSAGSRGTTAVAALMTTKWDQSPYYNTLCPYDNSEGARTVSGCVATAMAQIMRFWKFPATGTGSHTYNHSSYGSLAANFGATTYDWNAMPNTVSSSNPAVATLMYHCGVSVDMHYDVPANGGSGAYVISANSPITNCSEYALKNYFGYKSTLQGIKRSSCSQAQWIGILKAELDAGRPILHDGVGSGGGHCFVADGYDANDFMHFNWGWSGNSDGYFSVNALNPGSLGAGGGSGGFNSNQEAVIGIMPSTTTTTTNADMRLYSAIVINPSPVPSGAAFTATVSLGNFGADASKNFAGEYAAIVFNASNQNVGTVQIKTGNTLNFNTYSAAVAFSTAGISSLTPGAYTLGIYFKATGTTQWVAFSNGAYQNFLPFTIAGNNTNTLKLNTAITTTPAILVQNQTFSANFDVINKGASAFKGTISIDIHKSDGTWIKELSRKSNLSLASNANYAGGLTFTITGGLPDTPGTYQFFVWDSTVAGWENLGSGTFANPINVQIALPGLTPDIYEANNTVATSYILPANFSNDIALVKTTGSNIHVGNDYDFYKINLPAGFDYTISGRINDSYISKDGNKYTVDGLVSYSLDGTTSSEAYDDAIDKPFTVFNGGVVYFKVAPYFTGNKGTYLLDLSITRKVTLSIDNKISSDNISVYPNPAKDLLYINTNDFEGATTDISLHDIKGSKVLTTISAIENKNIKLNLHHIQSGSYLLKMNTNKGEIIKKVNVQ
jgi:hypothetical protein